MVDHSKRKTPKPSDSASRKKQAAKLVRVVTVHRMTSGQGGGTEKEITDIAKKLGVTERTIYRDLQALRMLYEALGTSLLDH